jgi:hemoglobin
VTKWSFFSFALLAGVGCAVAACSSDGDDSAASAGAGGTGGATSSGAAGKGGASSTLYDRLGGNDGIATAVDAIVAAEVGDSDIASYFSQQANPKYSPSVADIKECLVLQLDSVSGGPQKYPGQTTSGFTCRGMVEAHADLGINSGTFDKFVAIAGATIKDAVSADDLTTIAGVLNGTKPAIVTAVPDSDTEQPCTAPAACAAAAGAGGAG